MLGMGKAKVQESVMAPSASAPEPVAPAPSAEKEGVVAPNMSVRGDVEFEGIMRIEGEVHGKITGQGRLVVDPTGKVFGDIMAAEILVQGSVQGNVNAAMRLEVSGSAQIAGDIKASQFVVARGAKMMGRLDIDSESMNLGSNGRSVARDPAAELLEKVL
jgi:cytoskeletal protein CcmA (bactofilin family)